MNHLQTRSRSGTPPVAVSALAAADGPVSNCDCSHRLTAQVRRVMWAVATLLVCMSLSACATSEEPVEVREDDILGGTVDKVDRSVVAISVYNQKTNHTCSGAIVAPHVVVTAAHCVDPRDVGADNAIKVFMGDTFDSPWPWLYKPIKEFHVHPDYNPNNLFAGNDIAVIITSGALAQPPMPMNRVALSPADVGQPIRFVGFGRTDASKPESVGRRFQTTLSISLVTAKLVSSQGPTSSTCKGDSGGPGLIKRNGVEFIAGINSFGPADCKGGNSSTRMDVFAQAFVDGFIKTADPGFKAP